MAAFTFTLHISESQIICFGENWSEKVFLRKTSLPLQLHTRGGGLFSQKNTFSLIFTEKKENSLIIVKHYSNSVT